MIEALDGGADDFISKPTAHGDSAWDLRDRKTGNG